MRLFPKALWLFLALVAFSPLSSASAQDVDRGTEAEAKALVERAAEFFAANGKEKTIETLQDPANEFIDRDLYVFAASLDGTRLANPKQPKLVGTSMVGFKDIDGKAYGDELIALAKDKGEGWVDYKFTDPLTRKALQKTAYMKKVGDILLVCGAYKD